MRTVTDVEEAITERFFITIRELVQRRVMRGLQTFTKRYNLNYGNMNTLMNHRGNHGVKTDMLAYLAKDYGVSCEWLLLGRGEIFTEKSQAREREHLYFAKVHSASDVYGMEQP